MPLIDVPDMENASLRPPMLDPGNYLVTIETPPKLGQSSNGHAQLELEMRVIEGPDQKDPDAVTGSKSPVGRKLNDWIVFKAAFKIKALLISAGCLARDDTTSEIAKGRFDSDILTGTKFRVNITHEMYDGKKQMRVDYPV